MIILGKIVCGECDICVYEANNTCTFNKDGICKQLKDEEYAEDEYWNSKTDESLGK